jgi:hypothetical protein
MVSRDLYEEQSKEPKSPRHHHPRDATPTDLTHVLTNTNPMFSPRGNQSYDPATEVCNLHHHLIGRVPKCVPYARHLTGRVLKYIPYVVI